VKVALDGAAAALGSGLEVAMAEGARLSLDEAVAYARRARGRRGRPSTGWASLSPVELRVIELVADGLTNPQVAERLFIATGTVKTHLAHIFNKLGVGSRTELAALAVRRDRERQPSSR
jgi:DNA-binding CsgD family transcriptional regulator